MIRDSTVTASYWDEWVSYNLESIEQFKEDLKVPSGDESYRPQFVFGLAKKYWHLMLRLYSRGDAVGSLSSYFEPMLDAWEESNRLHMAFMTVEGLNERYDWSTNLDHYIVCFWLVGLALSLELDDSQWQRLLRLIGNEGNDILLDRIIATRQSDRLIGSELCHPKPYARLLKVIDAAKNEQPLLLRAFVENWYPELDRKSKPGSPAMYRRPYWYTYGDQNMEGGAYFGRWCIEAVAAVKAFGIDDSCCLGVDHYPGDLLRPEGPSTHSVVASEHNREVSITNAAIEGKPPAGFWRRLLGK